MAVEEGELVESTVAELPGSPLTKKDEVETSPKADPAKELGTYTTKSTIARKVKIHARMSAGTTKTHPNPVSPKITRKNRKTKQKEQDSNYTGIKGVSYIIHIFFQLFLILLFIST